MSALPLSESSELLPLPMLSVERLDEVPNIDRNRPQRFLGGWPSEPVESEDPDRRCGVTFSGGAGGTTRSKETKRFTGDSWLSHRMMMIRRPGAGVHGAEDNGVVSPSSALD